MVLHGVGVVCHEMTSRRECAMKMKALIVNTSGIKTLFVRLENTDFFERGGESLGVGGELEAGGG